MSQKVATFFGGTFVLFGIFGFWSGSSFMTTGMELGIFPVNIVHNLLHILVGLWGLNAARTMEGAIVYCKRAGVLYLLLGILGLIPATVGMFAGVIPIGGYDHLLHLVAGLILVSVGIKGASWEAAT